MKITSVLFSLLVLTSCYYPEDKRQVADEANKSGQTLTQPDNDASRSVHCRFKPGLACIEGRIIKAPEVSLEGTKYFDADELGNALVSHIQAKLPNGSSFATADYSIELNETLDNESFASDFQVYVKGDQAMERRVSNSGSFSLDNLAPGRYMVSVQKKIDFQVVPVAKTPPSSPEAEESRTLAPTEVKHYCAALYYSEDDLYLDKNQGLYLGLDDFRLKLFAQPCRFGQDWF